MDEEILDNAAVPAEEDNRGRWYVLQALSGQELKIRDAIMNSVNRSSETLGIYETYVPEETVVERRSDKGARTFKRRTFPGYVMVRADIYDSEGRINQPVWYLIRQTPGVLGFLGGDKTPKALTAEEYRQMLPRESGDGSELQIKADFFVGDHVRIRDGAFMGYEGVVESVDRVRGCYSVIVSIFGRDTPVDNLGFEQVGPVDD